MNLFSVKAIIVDMTFSINRTFHITVFFGKYMFCFSLSLPSLVFAITCTVDICFTELFHNAKDWRFNLDWFYLILTGCSEVVGIQADLTLISASQTINMKVKILLPHSPFTNDFKMSHSMASETLCFHCTALSNNMALVASVTWRKARQMHTDSADSPVLVLHIYLSCRELASEH